MRLSKYYIWLGHYEYFVTVAVLFFFLGVILGAILWAWSAMRKKKADLELRFSTNSMEKLRAEVAELERRVEERESRGAQSAWSSFENVTPALARELDAQGIADVTTLQSLNVTEQRALAKSLGDKGLKWDWQWVESWKSDSASGQGNRSETLVMSGTETSNALSDGESGGQKPGDNRGHPPTGSTTQESPNSNSSPGDSDSGDSNSGDSNSGDKHSAASSESAPCETAQSETAPCETAESETAESETAECDTNPEFDPSVMPVFDLPMPQVKDDLTLLDGIGAEQAEALHEMGIHDFDQLHDLSPTDRDRLQRWFHSQGWHLDMQQWRIASEGNTLSPTMESIQQKAFEIYEHREREGLGGWEKTDWDQAEWELRGNPIFGYGVPHHVDDFAANNDGITPHAREELYRMGLYNQSQLDSLDVSARRMLVKWFAGPRFRIDLTSAFNWLNSLKSVPQDRDFGTVMPNRPPRVDDLSRINGIGPSTERELNRIGVYRFRQIAMWTQENIESISDTLNLGDRVEKDAWISQAERFARWDRFMKHED